MDFKRAEPGLHPAARILTLAALLSTGLSGGAVSQDSHITVHVTDHANVRGVEKAKAYVERVFGAAGVSISWSLDAIRPCEGLNLFFVRSSPGSSVGRSSAKDRRAWIFSNRVTTLAERKNMDERVLLGRAIVHELGHLLHLEHSRDGVMRAEIYTEAMEAKFSFTAAEAEDMRAEIARRSAACNSVSISDPTTAR